MKTIVQIVPFFALAAGIALLLSVIAELDDRIAAPDGGPVTVFSDRSLRMLTDETIVDELSALGLATRLKRVTVRTSVLEADFICSANALLDAEAALNDMGKLAKLALAESGNISRVIIRVLEENEMNGQLRLLAALSGAKAEFSAAELQRLRDGEPMPYDWLRNRMKLTMTERFRAAMAEKL